MLYYKLDLFLPDLTDLDQYFFIIRDLNNILSYRMETCNGKIDPIAINTSSVSRINNEIK